MKSMKYLTLLSIVIIAFCGLGNSRVSAADKAYRDMTPEELIISYHNNSGSREMAVALKENGTALINEGRMVDALRMLTLGVIISERGGYDDIYSICASNLGVVYGYFGEYGSSAFYNELSLKKSEETGDTARARIAANNLLQTYCNMSEIESADRIFKWLADNPSSEVDNGFRDTFNAYTLYTAGQNYVEAYKYAKLLSDISAQHDVSVSDKVASLLVLGESLLNLNKYDEAFENAANGLQIAENEKLPGLQLEAYSLLTKIASAKGDDNSKNYYIRLKNNLEDSVLNKKRYYLEKQKLLNLQQDSVIKSLDLLRNKISVQKQVIVFVGVILLIAIVILYVIVRIHVRLNKAYRALYEKMNNGLEKPQSDRFNTIMI